MWSNCRASHTYDMAMSYSACESFPVDSPLASGSLFLRNARMYSRRFASGSEANWELLVSFATATLSLVGGRCRGHIFHATTPATAISTPATIPIGKRRELPDCIAAALPLGLN